MSKYKILGIFEFSPYAGILALLFTYTLFAGEHKSNNHREYTSAYKRDSSQSTDSVEHDRTSAVKQVYDLDTMIVSATKTSTTKDRVVEDVEIFNAEDISRSGSLDASEILNRIPGITTNSARTQTNIMLNGMEGEYVKVLVNGIPATGNVGGGYPVENVATGDINKIEVVSGGASAMYGTDAVSGIVNIITESNRKNTPLGAEISYRYLNNDTIGEWGGENHINLGLSHKTPGFSLEGFLDFDIDKGLSRNVVSDAAAYRELEYPEKISKKAAVNSKVTPNETLNIKGRLSFTSSEELRSAVTDQISLKNEAFSANLKGEYSPSEEALINGYISLRSFTHTYSKRDQILSVTTEKETAFKDYEGELRFTKHKLFSFGRSSNIITGANLLDENIKSENMRKKANRTQGALFVSAMYQTNTDMNLVVNPRLRLTIGENLREDNTRNIVSDLSPKIGIRFNDILLNELYIRSYYGASFKIPRLKKMYYSFNMGDMMWLEGNEDIEPEKAYEFNTGIGYDNDMFSLSVSGHYTTLSNMIVTKYVREQDNKQVYRGINGEVEEELSEDDKRLPLKTYYNAQKGKVYGGKFKTGVKPLNWINLVLYYTHTFSEIAGDDGGTREQENYIPNKTDIRASFDFESLKRSLPEFNILFTWEDRYIDDYDENGEKIYTKTFQKVNLNFRKQLSTGLSLDVGINNLLDAEKPGLSGAFYGRTYFAGINMDFDDITDPGSAFEPFN